MIFVDLIYRHFDIWCLSMIRWIKVMLFRAAPKWYLGSILQGLRTQNPPKHIRAPLFAMNTTQTPLRHPTDTPQTPPSHLQWIKILTDDDTQCKGVWRCLLAYVVVWWHLGFPGDVWECLGGVWRMFEGCLGAPVWISWKSKAFGFGRVYLGSQSLWYEAKTLFWSSPESHDFYSSHHTETSKYQNVYI